MMGEGDIPGRRERKKAATRSRIVEAAAELFTRQGYQATSIEEIAEAADIAARTFYSYFDAKVDVAIVQLESWMSELIVAIEGRPEGETPDQMYVGALDDLASRGFDTGGRSQGEPPRSLPPMGVGLLLAETEPQVAGRIYQMLSNLHSSMTLLFRRRLHLPEGSVQPHIVAGAVTASWFVAVHGYSEMVATHADPPSTDQLGISAFAQYTSGLGRLWGERATTDGFEHGPEPSAHGSLGAGEEIR
jgi:AcrR family transcriptional regulator